MHVLRSLAIVNRPDAASEAQHTPARGLQHAAAAEAIVACLNIEQDDVAGIRLIDKTSSEHRDGKGTHGGVA